MEPKNESGIERKNDTSETKTVVVASNPITANTKDAIVRSFIRRHWWKLLLGGAVLVIPVLGTLTEIPNNVMNWATNWRALNQAPNDGIDELRARLKAADPLIRPIVSVAATAKIKTKGEILFKPPADPYDSRCRLIFIRGNSLTNALPSSVALTADGNDITLLYVLPRSAHPDEHEIIIRFDMVKDPVLQNIVGSPSIVEAGVFNEVGGLIMELPELGTDVFVTSGTVVVEVNSSLRWEFPIPPQKQEYGFVSCQITTNAAKLIEARILPFPIVDWVSPPRFTNRFFDGK